MFSTTVAAVSPCLRMIGGRGGGPGLFRRNPPSPSGTNERPRSSHEQGRRCGVEVYLCRSWTHLQPRKPMTNRCAPEQACEQPKPRTTPPRWNEAKWPAGAPGFTSCANLRETRPRTNPRILVAFLPQVTRSKENQQLQFPVVRALGSTRGAKISPVCGRSPWVVRWNQSRFLLRRLFGVGGGLQGRNLDS